MSTSYDTRKNTALEELKSAIEHAIDNGEKVRIDKKFFSHQLVTGTFLALTELSHSIYILVENDKSFDAEILLRTMFELQVKLQAFARFEDLPARERLKYALGELKILREAEAGNPYFKKIAEHIDTRSEIASLEEIVDGLKSDGVKEPHSIKTLCEMLDFSSDYEGLYRRLSQLPHGTFSGIIKRNLPLDQDAESFAVVGFRLPEIETVEAITNQATDWLKQSTELLVDYLAVSHVQQPNA